MTPSQLTEILLGQHMEITAVVKLLIKFTTISLAALAFHFHMLALATACLSN